MEELIAKLEVGESGSVETDAGTHLVLVTDRRAGSSVTFEEVRGELAQRMQDDDAAAALLRDVERLRDISFNAADLSEPARELDLEVQRVDDVTRDAGEGLLAEARLRRAAFSEDVLEAGHNSEVIELSPQRFAVLRVAERKPPAQQPLAQVRGRIERTLRDEKAAADAAATAEALAARIREGERLEDIAMRPMMILAIVPWMLLRMSWSILLLLPA